MTPILENIDLGEKKSILAFRYSNPDFDAPWHFHPQHELTYIEKSVGTKFIGDYVGLYEPGELVLLRSNLPHSWKNRIGQTQNSESLVVQWNTGIYPKVPELLSFFDMLKAASRGVVFSGKDIEPILPRIEKLISVDGYKLYIDLLYILADLSFCSYRTLSKVSFENNVPNEHTSRMSKIHDFVENNYHRKIYLKELAELVSMSEQSFSRFFSKMMGQPFFTFLNKYRINMASRMLIDTDWPVAHIGFACGYESLPFFYTQFKKDKKDTPNRYRKKYITSIDIPLASNN